LLKETERKVSIMKTRNKALLLMLCAVLLVAGSVFGTMAYLTDSKTVVNTFTVGDVAIKLDETVVKPDGTATADPAVRAEAGNAYHLLPGHKYTKDPQVHVLEGSEESYIRMVVKVNKYSELKEAFPTSDPGDTRYTTWYDTDNKFLFEKLVEGLDAAKWCTTGVINVDTSADIATYEFRYYVTVKGPADDADDGTTLSESLDPLFTKLIIPGSMKNDEIAHLQKVTIDIEAHAIQKDGFNTADAAWGEF